MNKQLFDLYRQSERGKNAIASFAVQEDTDIPQFVERLLEQARVWGCDIPTDLAHDYLSIISENFAERGLWDGDLTRESWADFIDWYEIIIPDYDEGGAVSFSDDPAAKLIRQEGYRNKAALTPFLSLFLFCFENGFFKPILLSTRHDIFTRNCEALGLSLPPFPHTNKHREFAVYYYDLCVAIEEFQKENELSDEEVCAAIYDFALMLHADDTPQPELPEPTNVWLTGASDEDFKYLDSLGKDEGRINPANIWACNERTRRGDIVVIMCLSPRSYIHSIWRANSSGIFNPFDYYHSRTTVCNGIMVPPIKSKELKCDPYFANIPIVRKNFQGINGWELTAKDYSELLRVIDEHGGDTSALPRLFDGSVFDFGKVDNERDVEERILIPTLHRLGYTENDWTRQLRLKVGRGHREIPDFVFFAHGEPHFENAPMVIEAKYDMSSMSELRNAFSQALSYARMLHSSIMALCDKERVIIYCVDNNGTADINAPIRESHWAKVFSNEEEGARMKQIIGREVMAPRL